MSYEYRDNLEKLDRLETFLGGDNADVPINLDAISNIRDLVQMTYLAELPQPEVFPYAGGKGIQAEWDYKDFYIQVDSDGESVELFVCMQEDSDKGINIKIKNIQCCFNIIKAILNGIE